MVGAKMEKVYIMRLRKLRDQALVSPDQFRDQLKPDTLYEPQNNHNIFDSFHFLKHICILHFCFNPLPNDKILD